jgi:hypothetical protein
MIIESFFYNCSREYVESISRFLFDEVVGTVSCLPKRSSQAEINQDIFWILTNKGWSYDSAPSGLTDQAPDDLNLQSVSRKQASDRNNRNLCVTSTTLEARWHSDFAKSSDGKLVQIEVQFGKVESMFKDFCGFTIARFERRLSLGIEIILCEPNRYFSHRR